MSLPSFPRFPEKLSKEEFYPLAYHAMYLSRRLEDELAGQLYDKGYVKGTVTSSAGNESTAVGFGCLLRPGIDIVALLHRDFASHLLLGATPYQLVCQYMANADSPTHGREGNAHHGDVSARRLPMISHLGKMLSVAVGATWAARRNGEDAFGLAVVGDGGSSTGEFHESLNIASVHKVPILFLVENNYYSFSTPVTAQYNCRRLSDRAVGYGVAGRTIDGLDAWGVYCTVWEMLDAMRCEPAPAILECMTTRLKGHAAYDQAKYVPRELIKKWRKEDPLPATRRKLLETGALSEEQTASLEKEIDDEIRATIARALKTPRLNPRNDSWEVYAEPSVVSVRPYRAEKVKNGDAVRRALDYILSQNPRAFILGLDVGVYGSAFKTCEGLIERYGADRVIDMPLSESAMMGFSLGASQVGTEPIFEFQFSDFATEAVSQMGLNASTWFYRSGSEAPLLIRLPCGGGLTMGAFHSGEFEGIWARFPGLKLLYPSTPQETFEALVAGFYDRNPCLVFEHKGLYWRERGTIDFNGDLKSVWRARRHTQGTDVTVVTFGAMLHEALAAASRSERSMEIWNPFVLQPMDLSPVFESVKKTGRLLVVQECGESRGLGDRVIFLVARACHSYLKCAPEILAAPDVPVPFAPELEDYYRPNARKIVAAVEKMFGDG